MVRVIAHPAFRPSRTCRIVGHRLRNHILRVAHRAHINPKHEIRNPKQGLNRQNRNVLNPVIVHGFGFWSLGFWNCFGFRDSDFGF